MKLYLNKVACDILYARLEGYSISEIAEHQKCSRDFVEKSLEVIKAELLKEGN